MSTIKLAEYFSRGSLIFKQSLRNASMPILNRFILTSETTIELKALYACELNTSTRKAREILFFY